MQNKRSQSFLAIAIALILFVIAFICGMLFYKFYDQKNSNFFILKEAYGILEKYALSDLPADPALEYGMIHGMVSAYGDQYTSFVEPPQHELQTDQLEGKFGGIGSRIERSQEGKIYLYPLPGSSAEKAGIEDGDILQEIDSVRITIETSLEEIQAAIRGPIGHNVNLVIFRESANQSFKIGVKREEIAIPSVTFNLLPENNSIGIVHISLVAETTPEEVENSINQMQADGATKFVIDLRNNGGGLVDAGVKTAGLFLPESIIMQQQYRGKAIEDFENKVDGPFVDLPIVLLVNQNTASSAEIIAGAIKAQKRAVLIGENTFGKNSIQLVFDLSDDSSLHVTSAKWWIPGLENLIESAQITPDVILSKEELSQSEIYLNAAGYFPKN